MNSSTPLNGERTPDDPVGGADHVAAARAELDAVRAGGTRAMVFTGGQGLGKTAMVNHLAESIGPPEAVVLRGRCLDIGEVSWCPLLVGLRAWLARPALAPGVDAGAVAELVGLLQDGEAMADNAGVLFHGVSEGLRKIAAGRPLVLVVDDLQHVDNATLWFLKYLLAGLGPDRVLLIAALRLDDLRPDHRVARLLTDLRRQPAVTVRELKPLSRAETDALVARIAGPPATPERNALLWRRSRGIPFLVEALAVAERDQVGGLPDEVRDMALAQVEALSDDARTVVQAVAVCRRPVHHTLLRQVTGLSRDRLAAAVTAARRERVLDDGPNGYHIHVGLYAEVIQSALERPDRIRLNERFAEALCASGGVAERGQVARHWLAAERPRDAWRCAVEAAERAQHLHRYGEAHAYWAMAASVVERTDDAEVPPERRQGMWRDAAEAAHQSGDHEAALRILDRLASTLPKPLPSWWHLHRARFLARSHRPLDALTEYRVIRSIHRGCAPDERARATAHLADLLVQLGHYSAAQQAAGEALTLIGDLPAGSKTRALAASALGVSRAHLDDPGTGLATLRDALAEAERHGTPEDVILVRQRLAELLTGPLNDLDHGIEVARVGAELAERSGLSRKYGVRLSAVVAAALFRAGRWDEASAAIAAGLERTPSGGAAVELLLGRAEVALARGDLARGESDLAAVEALTAGGGSIRHVLPLFTLRAGLAIRRGDHAAAADAVETGLARWEPQTEDLQGRAALIWQGLRAAAEDARRGADGRVAGLVTAMDDLASAAARAAAPVRDAVEGHLALCRAELARVTGESTVDAWAHAVAVWEPRGHPYPEAYTLLRLAQARYDTGPARNAEAARSLTKAYHLAKTLGAGPLTADVTAFAARVRVDLEPAPKAAPGPLALLTKREIQVLGLAEKGLTNELIGKDLFISPKTVGVHMSSVLAKLQVPNRVQAGKVYRTARPSQGA